MAAGCVKESAAFFFFDPSYAEGRLPTDQRGRRARESGCIGSSEARSHNHESGYDFF